MEVHPARPETVKEEVKGAGKGAAVKEQGTASEDRSCKLLDLRFIPSSPKFDTVCLSSDLFFLRNRPNGGKIDRIRILVCMILD